MRLSLIILSVVHTSFVLAKDIELSTRAERIKLIRSASVWKEMDSLTPKQIFDGPQITEKDPHYLHYLQNKDVYCETSDADQKRFKKGKTSKFYCQLITPRGEYVTKRKGGRRVVKVKYNPPGGENREIESEIIGTRLLWALGFYADRMFYVDRTHCYGCTADPFKDRVVDTSTEKAPRIFNETALEYKLKGDKILSWNTSNSNSSSQGFWDDGIWFREMMRYLPARERSSKFLKHVSGGGLRLAEMLKYMKPVQHTWATQYTHRDALRLLAIFMNHVDMKGDNNRFVCLDKKDGKCVKSIIMTHDLGTSFGVRAVVSRMSFEKANFDIWKNLPVWKNPKKCVVKFSNDPLISIGATLKFDATQTNAIISEAGRHFLFNLLSHFASNKDRVRALFQAARMTNSEVEKWTDVFMDKVEQIRYPMGRENPDFRCPPTRFERRRFDPNR